MQRLLWSSIVGVLALLLPGCFATEPLLQNPSFFPAPPCTPVENPVFLPQGPQCYGALFEMVLDVMSDYFDVQEANRYGGRITTFPKIAPGLEQPFRPGSPDFDQRLLATMQTIRHYAIVTIRPVDDGGFLVNVAVNKELEDLPRPTRAIGGAAAFRNSDMTVERQQDVVDITYLGAHWIPIGRDVLLEQAILQRISRWDRSR